jgi:hypothetical protein
MKHFSYRKNYVYFIFSFVTIITFELLYWLAAFNCLEEGERWAQEPIWPREIQGP